MQPPRSCQDGVDRPALGVTLPHELLGAELEQVDAGRQDGAQRRAGEIRDHRPAVPADVDHEPAVEVGIDDAEGLAAGDEGQVGVECRRQRHPVEPVGEMPIEGSAVHLDDLDALAGAAIVNVCPVRRPRGHGQQRDRLGVDQAAKHAPRLPSECAAERDGGPERPREAGDPESLPAGVQVQRRAVVVGLDGDREHRRGREDDQRAEVLVHIASVTIRHTGAASDGTEARVKRDEASWGDPS